MNNKVLVVGESCQDIFQYGKATRLCPDVPAPILKTDPNIARVVSAGMAANTARNLKSLGLEVELLTQPETITKTRYVEKDLNYTFLRVDSGEENLSSFEELFRVEDLAEYRAIVISDYDKGFLSEKDIKKLCLANPNTFIDTKKVLRSPLGEYCSNAAFIKINGIEFESIKTTIALEDWTNKLIVTLGDRGCMFYKEQGFAYYPVDKVDIFDLSGAGDTFLAALVFKYLENECIEESIKYANKQASRIVQQKGVAAIQTSLYPKLKIIKK